MASDASCLSVMDLESRDWTNLGLLNVEEAVRD